MNTVTTTGGMDAIYSDLVFSDLFLFETRDSYFQERLVQIIWNECLLKEDAVLADGRPLRVVHPGVWNLESGPDFKEATLFVENATVRGSVEIHIRPTHWNTHGHHLDPAYDGIALHVVWDNPGNHVTYPETTPLLVLKGQTCMQIEDIVDTFNVADYPYSRQVQPVSWAARVADMDDQAVVDLLHSYGLARILQKARAAGEQIHRHGLDAAAYHMVCDSLGYKNNRDQFAEIADLLPLADLDGLDSEERLALLFGAAGLLPDPCTLAVLPKYKSLLSRLWNAWWCRRREFREIHWNRRQRPFNAPERRLLSLSMILDRCDNRPGARIVQCFTHTQDPKQTLTMLRDLFVLEIDEWQHFFRFDKELEKGAALMGRSRADDFIINAAIPLYFAWCFLHSDVQACHHARDVLLAMTRLQTNRAFKEAIAHLIVPPSRATAVVVDACAQQGLLKLYRSFFELN